MNKSDLAHGWERLQCIYTSLPALHPAVAEEWFKVLKSVPAEDFQAGIDSWIANEKYRPVPYELLKHCRKAGMERERRKAEAEARANGECPWCGGMGVVTQYEAVLHCGAWYDACFPCQCGRSQNPELGRRILATAQNDPAWVFDPRTHGFRRRTSWLGDPDQGWPDQSEQAKLWEEAKAIGGSLSC